MQGRQQQPAASKKKGRKQKKNNQHNERAAVNPISNPPSLKKSKGPSESLS